MEEVKTNVEIAQNNEAAKNGKESFWDKINKPISPLLGWLIFGGFVVFVVLLGLIIFLNC